MKNDAIVCNIGHFDCEIDVKERVRFIASLASALKVDNVEFCFVCYILKSRFHIASRLLKVVTENFIELLSFSRPLKTSFMKLRFTEAP